MSKLQSFRQWDGAAWQPIAPDLALECQLAVRSTATIAAAATPVVACLRGPFPNEVVVYRLVP